LVFCSVELTHSPELLNFASDIFSLNQLRPITTVAEMNDLLDTLSLSISFLDETLPNHPDEKPDDYNLFQATNFPEYVPKQHFASPSRLTLSSGGSWKDVDLQLDQMTDYLLQHAKAGKKRAKGERKRLAKTDTK
jgi:hypothetical protein